MLLHCTLAGWPGSLLREPVELSIDVPPGCPGTRLEDAIKPKFRTTSLSVAGKPLSALTAGNPPLVNGAVLIDGPLRDSETGPAPESSGTPTGLGPTLMLAVLSGPGAGTVLPLKRGSFRIGRSGVELAVPDAGLSREHARLDVTDSGLTLVDLGSSNGSWVEGHRISTAPITTSSQIRCGNSMLAVVASIGMPGGREAATLDAGGDTSAPLSIPARAPAVQRTHLLLAAILPLIAGIVLAVLTGMWMFLAFTAFSALPLLVSAFTGRRYRRELHAAIRAAVIADTVRRQRAAPPAAYLVMLQASIKGRPAPRDTGPVELLAETDQRDGGHPAGPVRLRLGVAEQPANVRLLPDDPGFLPPSAGIVPVVFDPSVATVIDGPAQSVAGLVRSLLMQLDGYPRALQTWVHLHGPAGLVPIAARFLPRVSVSTSPTAAAEALKAGPGRDGLNGILILLPDSPAAETVAAEASRLGWQRIDGTPASGPTTVRGQRISLRGQTATLTSPNGATDFVADLVPEPVFDRYCRRQHPRDPPVRAPLDIPGTCSLENVLPLSEAALTLRWTAGSTPPTSPQGLSVPVGRGKSDVLRIDLQSDGPHLLVAGTTGSGKSEFLRTLVFALAASYPPSRVNLLFIDFKGGSGLGPLTGLPHCVGFLTDLDEYEVDRTLVSLRAEVRRREKLLAGAGAADLASFEAQGTGSEPLPHLVLVIDEFRMLVEDAPMALAELMRIAVIGRSLGIHLVMATQRPQGALSADIRANVTSSVVLRMQSDAESVDVMNSRLAATIPIRCPGRAYLIRGSGVPEEFQTATVTGGTDETSSEAITVMTAEVFLDRPFHPPLGGVVERQGAAPPESAATFVDRAARLWKGRGEAAARQPVAPPLPTALAFHFSPLDRAPAQQQQTTRGGILLGKADLPDQQRVVPLMWVPEVHGHLALIGGRRQALGGPADGLLLTLHQLLGRAEETHLYLLDADGSLAAAAHHPRVGAWVGPQEIRRAARLLSRLIEEVAVRLATPPVKASRLVLIVQDWGAWVSAFRSGPYGWAEDLVQDIVRSGPNAGITVVFSGDRELATARFFAALPNRIYYPAGSTEESRLAWPPLPRFPALPNRVAVSGPFLEAGFPGAFTPGFNPGRPTADVLRVAQLYSSPAGAYPAVPEAAAPDNAAEVLPFRVEALPARVTIREVESRTESIEVAKVGRYRIGVGGDELLPATLSLPPSGVAAVVGSPGAGKSTLLKVLPLLNPSTVWLGPGGGEATEQFWTGVQRAAAAGTLDRSAVLLADDLDLASAATNAVIRDLNGLGWRVIFSAGYGPTLQQRVPLAHQARGHGLGVLIRPRSMMDGELFSVRFEPEPHPPVGRAVLIGDGRATPVQLALPDPLSEAG